MPTECGADLFGFALVEGRRVEAAFDTGLATSDTRFARATCGRIRLKLLKIAALVRISVRRIRFAMPSAFPYQAEFAAAHA